MILEINRIYDVLASFLGEAKNGFDGVNMQLQFPCPKCIEREGEGEASKYNLEVNLQKQLFLCWKCSSMDSSEMHGSIIKLIRMYGNGEILARYNEAVKSFRESELYKLHFSDDDFNITKSMKACKEMVLPSSYRPFEEGKYYPKQAMDYLVKRNIGWDIIKEYNIGFISYDKNYRYAQRIIIPSYDSYGQINYWTGRDYTLNKKRQRYYNPNVDRKSIIFDEDKLQWDADITLVEGPFDHIVVPNSVPLLGKALTPEYKLYKMILKKAKGKINIFLDGDAFETVKKIYKELNHGELYGRIRYIPVSQELDPSEIYEKWGRKGIIEHLSKSAQITNRQLLQF